MSSLERELQLPEDFKSVTRARLFVRDTLFGWDLAPLVDDAQLGTSELVGNAVRYAGTDLVLRIRVNGGVTIAIHDGQPELRRPIVAGAGLLAETGRGLQIVAAISQDWGITTASNGKAVWFNLALPDRSERDADAVDSPRRRNRESPSFERGGEQMTEMRRVDASPPADRVGGS